MGYLVDIKPSARRTNPAAGSWVSDHGGQRCFESKAAARSWAREVSEGSTTDGGVYVRDANPADRSPADGYLVGHVRPPATPGEPPGQQADLSLATGEE